MITSIHYKNFKALQDATLPLGRFTLIVGANGTGKTTALRALRIVNNPKDYTFEQVVSVGKSIETTKVEIEIEGFFKDLLIRWDKIGQGFFALEEKIYITENDKIFDDTSKEVYKYLKNFTIFNFDTNKIASPVPIQADTILEESGRGLAGILDQLRDSEPERFEELNKELNRWFYEYDRILFEVPADGQKSFLLRTTVGKHKIKASELSDGTLLALAYLTIAYLPNPPKIVAFEEPEKGIHPRLLRNIQEAMYRLAYPENYGEKREPIQVIATTHSPYLLDLFKDNPEEIVIASKDEKGVHFERLMDKPHIEEILQDAPLGEIWYSGVLGGVPAHI